MDESSCCSSANNELLIKVKNWYRQIKKAELAAGEVTQLKLDRLWGGGLCAVLDSILNSSKTVSEALGKMSRTELFAINADSDNEAYNANTESSIINQLAVDWQLKLLEKQEINLQLLPPEVEESDLFWTDKIIHEHRKLSPDFFRQLNAAIRIKKFLPNDRGARIMELGAGNGQLAKLLCHLGKISQYIICDLSETLCFSYLFLSHYFPSEEIFLVESEDDFNSDIIKKAKFVFIPVLYSKRLDLFGQVDMFINVSSMAEMDNAVIRYWYDLIQNKINPKYMTSINRFLNTAIPGEHDWRFEENESYMHYDRSWEVMEWELEPEYTRCPYVIQRYPRYLHLVTKRVNADNLLECEQRSEQHYKEVMYSEEFLFRDVNPTMTHRDNLLVNDLTMSGTLYKLWESIRLNPNQNNLWAMIEKLGFLMYQEAKIFEESPYYEKALSKTLAGEKTERARQLSLALSDLLEQRKKITMFGHYNPILVESMRGYNIVGYQGELLGVPQCLGSLDIAKIKRQDYPQILVSHDIDKLRELIAELA